MATLPISGPARSLTFANEHLFVAADDGGLVIALIDAAAAPSATPPPTATGRWPAPTASPPPTARVGPTYRPVVLPFLSRP